MRPKQLSVAATGFTSYIFGGRGVGGRRATSFSVLYNGQLSAHVRGFKDGACFCHCAYVLRIARNSGFLWVVRRKQNLASALGIEEENWG